MPLRLAALAVLAAASAACAEDSGAGGPPMLVSAAASLTEVLQELEVAYEREGGQSFQLNLAASNVLARQIESGAPVDLIISADEGQMDRLVRAGRVRDAHRRPLLRNQLAIVVPAGSEIAVDSAKDLLDPQVRRVAIGDPAAVPAGVYARAYLERAGVWQALAPKLVPSGSVRAALAAVEGGHADAAIVYRTDVKVARGARLAHLVPLEDAPPIRYVAATIAGSPRHEDARALLEWLQGPSASAIFAHHGFTPSDVSSSAP